MVAGAVLKHTRDFNLTREAVLGSALSPHTPACDLQQACGTGLEAVVYVANKIRLGQMDVGIAGGVDCASDAPLVAREGLRKAMLALSRARSVPEQAGGAGADPARRPGARAARRRRAPHRPEHGRVARRSPPRKWGVTREEQDELALASHRNLAARVGRGLLRRPGDPVPEGVARTASCGPTPRKEALAKLRTVFGKGDDATMTAGNSTALTDGAAVVLLAEEEYAPGPRLARAGPRRGRPGGRRRLHHRRGGPPAGARPRDPGAAGAQRPHPGGLRLPRDPRGVRRHRAGDDRRRWSADGVGTVDRVEAQRQRLVAGGGSPLRGHRRPHRRVAGEDAARARARARRGLVSICAAGGQGVVAILEA